MNSARYTPGHSRNASDFMARRTLASHGQFFVEYLRPGDSVLDCGCGPGSITQGIAQHVSPGQVVGVDFGASQIARADEAAAFSTLENVEFTTADCYALQFASDRFDRAFSHALFEHLNEPVKAAKELYRVLKPGGIAGICSPDWGGFIVAPCSLELDAAIAAYRSLQQKNGGDVEVGRKLSTIFELAGFDVLKSSARYECYDQLDLIGEYLARQLDRAGHDADAQAFRCWASHRCGLFAQAWVSIVARKNP